MPAPTKNVDTSVNTMDALETVDDYVDIHVDELIDSWPESCDGFPTELGHPDLLHQPEALAAWIRK